MEKQSFCPADCPNCVLAMVMGTYEVNGKTYEGHVGVCIYKEICAMWQTPRTHENCRWHDKPGLTDTCDRCKDQSEWEGKK